ncbi:PiggyBac transposable element-derived protein [Trinorchestia longiramus]|nr:PiggyBac transposable element-derived protein [Trinorchestia longiramus]
MAHTPGTSCAFSASSFYRSTRIKPSSIASKIASLDCTSDVESDLSDDDVLDPDFEALMENLSENEHKMEDREDLLAEQYSNGVVYDVFPYSGKIMPVARAGVPDLGPSSNAVLNLAGTIPDGKNNKIYFDNWFTSLKQISHLALRKIWACGTVQERRLRGLKVKSDKQLREQDRGSFDEHVTEIDGVSITTVKWHDNRSVCLASSFLMSAPLHQREKFDRKAKERIEVLVPNIVSRYNIYMGGTDLHDQYRMNFHAKRYYFTS